MGNENDTFDELTKNQFKKWSPFYDSKLVRLFYFERIYKRVTQTIKDKAEIQLKSKAKFLDVACGTGEIIFRLAKEFPQVEFVGVDFSRDMLEKAMKKTENLQNVKIIQTNAQELPFPDMLFDVILCSDALHHFTSPEKSLPEISRVTKREGFFFLVDPAFDTVFQKTVVRLFGKVFETAKKYYSNKEANELLERAGFTVKSGVSYYFTNFFTCRKR